jgi:hypothetical protein
LLLGTEPPPQAPRTVSNLAQLFAVTQFKLEDGGAGSSRK